MTLAYKPEHFSEVIEEWRVLAVEHWNEIALNKDRIKLNPNWAAYEQTDKEGRWFCVTARDGTKLVGYFIGFVMPHLHYVDSMTLFYDIFYLKPEYRKGRAGILLFKKVEEEAKLRGVEKIYVSTKLSHDMGKLFDYLDYTPIERVYSKMIG